MIVSSLAKVFRDTEPAKENVRLTCLLSDPVSFQIAFFSEKCEAELKISAGSDLKITAYHVGDVPVKTKQGGEGDDFILRGGEPGMYPDVLIPVRGRFDIGTAGWQSVWFDVESEVPGEYEIEAEIVCGSVIYNEKQKLTVYGARKTATDFKYTNWFHCDCLATQYDVPVFSEEHWEIIGNYLRAAAAHGQNMVLTPLFTPPLDTEVGGERPTVQLVDVVKDGNRYSFSFGKLERWVELCRSCGIEYFEMSHLFTQWGAKAAPKIMATEDGTYRQIFGWDTKASGLAYRSFILQLIPSLVKFISSHGMEDKVYFHVSDEPGENDFNSYTRARRILRPLLKKYRHIDALSHREYYDRGLVSTPVPSESRIHDFDDVRSERWVYYCCGPNGDGFVNRFIFMPSVRARALGAVMFRQGESAFLHWGFDFWYSQQSKKVLDPYEEVTADGHFPAGDGFVVYPGENGECLPSIRIKQMRDAINDYKALCTLAEKNGRHDALGFVPADLDYNSFPHENEWLLCLRNAVNYALSQ